MSDNKKDPLEELFQQKADEYNISYREEDWLKLEERLDKVDQQYKNRRNRRLIAAALAIVFSLLAYATYQNYMKINELNEKLNNQQTAEQQTSETPGNAINPNERNEQQKENESVAQEEENANSGNQDPASNQPLTENQPSDTPPESGVIAENTEDPQQEMTATKSITAISQDELQCQGCELINPKETVSKPSNSKVSPLLAFQSFESLPANDPTVKTTEHSFSRFSVSLSVAPDLSTAGSISDFQNPGHKLGISVQYHINENFSLSTGAIRSTVRYSASGQEYNPPTPYWNNGIVPDHTMAECVVLDIPVNLQYTFLHLNHSRFYATAGVSTYIMLNEEYQFEYEGNNSGLAQNWQSRTGTKHWMSNAGLSVGYEFDISSSVSLRAEPFIRVPLRNVGWGNVKLYSMGSFFSVNYKLPNF